MRKLTEIGSPPWSRDDIIKAISEFEALHDKRPIQNNSGGMGAPHMFATWFIARQLAPAVIIESGIWKGQSTWLLEQACPDAQLISIDIDLTLREYVSPRATYFDRDFSELDFSGVPAESTLVFIDDHQSAYARIQQCKWYGFKDVIFEDNYPSSQGDCYSLKKAFEGAGFDPGGGVAGKKSKSGIRGKIGKVLGVTPATQMDQYERVKVAPNDHDAAMLERNLETYYEFPPVFKKEATRWGDAWDDTAYPTPKPLLSHDVAGSHPLFWEQALDYTWICYARLKG